MRTAKARRFRRISCAVFLMLAAGASARAEQNAADPRSLIGTWRGTSICSDRVAAPACNDETVVYEFRAGAAPGTVHWAADKVVNGQRQPMGEMDLTFDTAEACWKGTFTSPRASVVWRLSVDGTHMTGTARLPPANPTVRTVDLRQD